MINHRTFITPLIQDFLRFFRQAMFVRLRSVIIGYGRLCSAMVGYSRDSCFRFLRALSNVRLARRKGTRERKFIAA